jgi:hypothetical protein
VHAIDLVRAGKPALAWMWITAIGHYWSGDAWSIADWN